MRCHDGVGQLGRHRADLARTRPCRRCSARGRRPRCACDPARWRAATAWSPSQSTKNDTSGPRQALLDDEPRAGGAELPVHHRGANGAPPPRRGSRPPRRPFPPPGRRLSRRPETRIGGPDTAASASSRRVADDETRGRNAVPRHELLGEHLRALEGGGRRGRTDDRHGHAAAKSVGDAPFEQALPGPTTVRSTPSRSTSARAFGGGPTGRTPEHAASGRDARIAGSGDAPR